MKILLLATLVAFVAISCNKIPLDWNQHPPKPKPVAFFDVNGKPIKAAAAGDLIKVQSPDIARLNREKFFDQGGQLLFDNIPAEIKTASADFVLLTLPTLVYDSVIQVNLRALLRNNLFDLCRACLLYQPTVRGAIFAGSTDGITINGFEKPAEMTIDATGNLFVIDQRPAHDIIIKVATDGSTTVLAGAGDEFGRLVGIALNPAQTQLLVADATHQQIFSVDKMSGAVVVLAGNGTPGNADGPALEASFFFNANAVDNFGASETGQGLTVNAAGDIFVGEQVQGITFGSQIRRLSTAGVVSTVPGSRIEPMAQEDVNLPSGLGISPDGTLFYTAGSSGFFQGVTRLTSAGALNRLAGKTSFEGIADGTGVGTTGAPQFSYPKAITYKDGYCFVADGTNGALRRVSSTGETITLAGVGHFATDQFCGCGWVRPVPGSYRLSVFALATDYLSLARNIRMNQVGGVAALSRNEIYVSDYGYKCIWKITIR